jgi:uncharacterized membrane protein YfcA
VGAWQYYRNGHLDLRAALFIALGLAVGITLSATFAQGLAPNVVRRGFAVLMVVVALRMWFMTTA